MSLLIRSLIRPTFFLLIDKVAFEKHAKNNQLPIPILDCQKLMKVNMTLKDPTLLTMLIMIPYGIITSNHLTMKKVTNWNMRKLLEQRGLLLLYKQTLVA